MSVSRDDRSNVYHIFPKTNKNNTKKSSGPASSQASSPANSSPAKKSQGLKSGQVIKAGDLNIDSVAAIQPGVLIDTYAPSDVSGTRVSRPNVISPSPQSNLALESLKQNFKALNDLQSRLRFMLQELEDIVKE